MVQFDTVFDLERHILYAIAMSHLMFAELCVQKKYVKKDKYS